MLNGIDISNWQKGIRLDRLPKLDLLIVKASQGTRYPDAYAAGFLDQARALGILRRGAYWWVETHEPVKAQLDVLLRHIERQLDQDPDLVLFVDWEPRNPERVATCVEAVTLLKAATGRQPHVYMNRSTAHTHRWQPVRDLGCHLWLAQYTHSNRVNGFQTDPWHQMPSGWDGRLAGLQYTDTGRLPGWNADLDLNRFWHWPGSAKEEPVTAVTPVIPTIRENDPKVWITTKSKSGWGCVCMQITLPLVETEMKRRGLIKNNIDYFQFGYNKGGVAASAGTHDGAGVVDCAQGITREQRQVWADFGWMMAPRTREWGWTGGAHGHGVLFGCVHRSPSAAAQIRSMMAGRNGLVSNLVTNWVKPSRTWQDAVRALAPAVTSPKADSKPATPHAIPEEEDPVPELREHHYVIDHDGIDFQAHPDHPAIGPDVVGPIIYGCEATITGPEGAKITTRWAVLNRKTGAWTYRSDPVDHASHRAYAAIDNRHTGGDPEVSIFLDVDCDKAGPVKVEQHARFWKKA